MAEGSRDGSSEGVGVLGSGRGSSRACLVSNRLTVMHEGMVIALTQNPNREQPVTERTFFFSCGTISKVMESSCLFSIKGRKAKKLI